MDALNNISIFTSPDTVSIAVELFFHVHGEIAIFLILTSMKKLMEDKNNQQFVS
jgi:hypothetical protein